VLKVIQISYAGMMVQGGTRFLQSGTNISSLPLLIRVRAPEDVSDFALSYIIQVIRDNMDDLHLFLQSMDSRVFVVSICLDFLCQKTE